MKQISEERQTAFYIGTGLMVLGLLLFLSTFVSFAMNFGDFSDFEGKAKSEMFRAFGGMALIIVGNVVRTIGARGMAGSGIVLDPSKARQDLEPYSRMAGGMVKDALEETGLGQAKAPDTVVKVRCQACNTLNQEAANFCQKCGKPMGQTSS